MSYDQAKYTFDIGGQYYCDLGYSRMCHHVIWQHSLQKEAETCSETLIPVYQNTSTRKAQRLIMTFVRIIIIEIDQTQYEMDSAGCIIKYKSRDYQKFFFRSWRCRHVIWQHSLQKEAETCSETLIPDYQNTSTHKGKRLIMAFVRIIIIKIYQTQYGMDSAGCIIKYKSRDYHKLFFFRGWRDICVS